MDECCVALWTIARGFGLGKTLEHDPQELTLLEKLLVQNNRLHGGSADTNLILAQHAHELKARR